ncbi:DUF1080 domain-containing protein [Catenovulum sp. 2E275]|uniref:3-keto-disaccharide hydrolase n=1 Tax=Catenovulum sp. 2E275 TaxID=2980497 RepID=UPI0021D2114F|nr:DUF1080 domain-containing protein [Catenovulum sp. 2E275]MCU4675677.1 DUF1080 domain-containing protein [Catenovulum sp. 2E275]
MKSKKIIVAGTALASVFMFAGCNSQNNNTSNETQANQTQTSEWISLFNGKDLTGWKIKFKGHPLGENYLDTFGVKDGKLTVSYDNYSQFDNKFGHIFYDHAFSNYIIKLEYRFIGEQVYGGAAWAFRNNGIMLHSQAPETMALEQDFPRSIEVQLLGAYDDQKPRTTANICTPSTNVVINKKLVTDHCINSTGKALPLNEWVQAEIEVHGSEKIIHRINGEVVFEYEQPQFEPNSSEAKGLDNLLINKGYISLQAESHPTEFRNIMLKQL